MAAPPTPVDLEAAIREALEGAELEDITQRSLRTTVRPSPGSLCRRGSIHSLEWQV